MKSRKVWLGMVACLMLFVVAACGGNDSATEEGKKKITFWHAMGGGPGQAIDEMVADFNAQSDTVEVEAVYQGSYEELLNQLRAVGGSTEAPSLVQVYEVGTKYMSDSGFITPMQEFVDTDGFDVNQLEENILGYYELDGDLYSMPFNTSNAIMFYNKDMFKEAGLDPENPPRTFEEVKEAAQTLTDQTDANGFAILIYGWFFEQLLANQGAHYLDQDNGRSGEPAEALINGEAGQNIFNWLNEMDEAGTLGNFGRQWDDIRAAFRAGQVAMYLDSTAATRDNVNDSPFEVGTAFLPHVDGEEANGVIVGGGSLWITNQVSDEEQQAAWEFVKYTADPEVQAKWAAATGYFPITPAAYEVEELAAVYEKFPQFTTAVEQLQNTQLTPATQGALMNVFPEARNIIENAIEELYEQNNPDASLNKAKELIDEALNH
ncbi:ABC transporter substrate-binding protein [Alkalihalophilus marmarensis]|uniref:ABC transporter substrate-binding protein n=1 Tax=Alkalihalophilus marmarensis TaxID=521377 RepID=UPI00203D37AA|nr:ABC transporter substrate-binding protein [Alkalihalophilus marmarensis]MCM3491046.1 ABC transporter substrate-binding protein [Alkalihalophilus marmarensis]